MPFLYHPRSTRYILPGNRRRTPDGQRVTKATPGAVRVRHVSKTWFGRWTDGAGERHQARLSKDKDIARRMLAKLAGDAQLAGVGIEDPFADSRGRPLSDHLADFERYLSGKGDALEHVASTLRQCRAVVDGCRFAKIKDVRASAVVDYLARRRAGSRAGLDPRRQIRTLEELAALAGIKTASVRRLVRRGMLAGEGQGEGLVFSHDAVAELLDRRGRGIGAETSNHYLASIKAFTKWLVKDRRTDVDVLVHLSRQHADVERRHPRRALREEAFAKFIEATAAGRSFRGLTGADRLVLYTLAANTGLRASELASLAPASFDLDAQPPTVTVEAGYSKHRRQDEQPLRADVAAMMRQYLAGQPALSPLWPGTWPEAGAEMVRRDLAAAGLVYEDERGRVFDFHATRGQFISTLAAAGVHPKVAQALARHSTVTLTMDFYTHLDVFDVGGALEKLPALPGPSPAVQRKDGRRHA
jgi:integrase